MTHSERPARLPRDAEALLERWPAPEKSALEWESLAAATMDRIRSGQPASGADVLAAPLPAEPHEGRVEPGVMREGATSLEAVDVSRASSAELRDGGAISSSIRPPAIGRHERVRRILWASAIAAAAAGLALYVAVRSEPAALTPAEPTVEASPVPVPVTTGTAFPSVQADRESRRGPDGGAHGPHGVDRTDGLDHIPAP